MAWSSRPELSRTAETKYELTPFFPDLLKQLGRACFFA
jgi:hypothetical protein